MNFWNLFGGDQIYNRYSSIFSITGTHKDNVIGICQWDYDRMKIDTLDGYIFLAHDLHVLKREVQVNNNVLPGQVHLPRDVYEELDLPPEVLLLRPHTLTFQLASVMEEKRVLEQKLLLVSVLVHMGDKQVMEEELREHFNVDARAYGIDQLEEGELGCLIKELISDNLVTFRAEYRPPVLYPVVKLDNKHHLSEAIGIELEGLNSYFKNFDPIDDYRIIRKKYHVAVRKLMLFTIFMQRFIKRLSADMGSCINAMHVQIREKRYSLLPFTGLDSKLWRQIRPIREEFLEELNKLEQTTLCIYFSMILMEVKL